MTPFRIAFVVYAGALLGFDAVGYDDRAVIVLGLTWGIFTLIVAQLVVWALDVWRNPPRLRW